MDEFNTMSTAPDGVQVYSVSALSRLIKGVLEATFPEVWVAGEISNLSQPASGHCYFTLKDSDAQLKGVLWKSTLSRLPFRLQDGLAVICRGRLDLYPPRGTYQLVVDQLLPQGLGPLELALRQLKEKLQQAGLFDPAKKRPLPPFPRRVAFVTSPSGAAIKDFLEVLRRRWKGVDVLVVPTRVQGTGAAREIASAIELVNRLTIPIDVLVVGRGGGSLEDLWAFNEEPVVRAVASSRIVTISAVGHEIDLTLCDLAADVRALTPSEAAERVAPSAADLSDALQGLAYRLQRSIWRKWSASRADLERWAQHRELKRPMDRLLLLRQRLDDLNLRGNRAVWNQWKAGRQQWLQLAAQLQSLSPLQVLSRGYALCEHPETGQVLKEAGQVQVGDRVHVRLAHGMLTSRVEHVQAD